MIRCLACRVRSYGGTELQGSLAKYVFLSWLVCFALPWRLACRVRSYGGTELEEVFMTYFCFV